MSLISFRRKRKIGVIKPSDSVCVVAAVEVVSPGHKVSPKTYRQVINTKREKEEGITRVEEGGGIKAVVSVVRTLIKEKVVERRLLAEVGVKSPRDVSEKKSSSPQATVQILDRARQDGRRVMIRTAKDHRVGLIPAGRGRWRIAGVGVSDRATDKRTFVSAEVHQFLVLGQPNIITLPPEKKQTTKKKRRK